MSSDAIPAIGAGTPAEHAHAHVLLIDDDPNVQVLVSTMLKPIGARTSVAGTGAEGLSIARSDTPDLILLDYDLPNLSGLDILEVLRMDPALARVPVVMVTGSESNSVLTSCFNAGAQDYIRKPFFAAELRSRVGSVLERQRLLVELESAARQDRLTGLPNRELLHTRLQAAIDQARESRLAGFSLMFLDFDRFKIINDSLGHDVGDQLLQSIAARLRENLRASDAFLLETTDTTVARLGGDEFVVLLRGVAEPEIAMSVAERLIKALQPPHQLGPHSVRSSASIGIACYSSHYLTADDMLRDADIAMYEAKCRGKARAVHFSSSMRDAIATRHAMENDLRTAIERQLLTLVYQPIVSLQDRSVAGVEALVRWEHPVHGNVPPSEFIPIAEETRLILPLAEWILRTACADFMRWQRESGLQAPGFVSVNLSRVQLTDPDLVQHTLAIVRAAGMQPQQLLLEVTESQIMANRVGATQLLHEFRDAGVRLAMDDFGTGHSSLSCLQAFPLDVLKIDREFIANLGRGRDYASLVHAVVTLADNLGLDVVAEGIEEVAQAAMLQDLGCRYGQGYLLSRPMTSEDLLANHRLPLAS